MASAILRKTRQGKWAVVTGASAGIGEAIAVEVIPYLRGRVQVFAQRFVPRSVVTSAVERLLRPATLK
jgi:NAD(P)-dependent dehydrogenase (short-subunit alcohol dehydrogenase family)